MPPCVFSTGEIRSRRVSTTFSSHTVDGNPANKLCLGSHRMVAPTGNESVPNNYNKWHNIFFLKPQSAFW